MPRAKAKPADVPLLNKRSLEYLPLDALIPYANNARTHSDGQIAAIAASIKAFSFTNPVLIDADAGIIAGHGRVLAARLLGMAEVPCIRLPDLTPTQRRALVLADNRLALSAGWNDDLLRLELGELKLADFDLALTGFTGDELAELLAGDDDPFGIGGGTGTAGAGRLAERFGVPPFSVLNAREGWWQNRKHGWIALGIQSELGRGGLANDRGQSASARINDAADSQAVYRRSKANAVPGGAPMPLDRAKGAR